MIKLASSLFDIDVAIFDLKSHLVACTEPYLRQKGKTVHAPSIDEVMAHGKIIVNKPGYMEACRGCRFTGQCPATIEILRAIQFDTVSVGAIAFTSFTKDGHDRITHDTPFYVEALKIFSEWLTDIILNKEQKRQFEITRTILQSTLDLSRASVFSVNHEGNVMHCNNSALQLFSFCDLYTRSLYHILPDALVDSILQGHAVKDLRVRINDVQGFVSSIPVVEEEHFEGAVIYIRHSMSEEDVSIPVLLPSEQVSFDSMKGRSDAIATLKSKALKVADSLSTILISGETGTGKGLLARAIHNGSNRSSAPFVVVNCASIPETLFESELFGYDEGAFTGAKKGGKAGRFELAEGGTLFLDEIGEMPLHMQVKLLNVLQDFSFQRVGGIAPIPIDVRFIAATNQNLEELMKRKKFRSDLYFRLHVIPMHIAPLRERKEDIGELVDEFVRQYCLRLNRKVDGISDELLTCLIDHDWPGNVRELQNVLEYCVNMTESETLMIEDLSEQFRQQVTTLANHGSSLEFRKNNTEMAVLFAALDKNGWSVRGKKAAAEELGIGVRTLYRKLKKFSQKSTGTSGPFAVQ